MTHSPPLLLVPKLLPTTPVQVHFFPALSVHDAVAVEPTVLHVTLANEVAVQNETKATDLKMDWRIVRMLSYFEAGKKDYIVLL